MNEMQIIGQDVSACFLALANALEAKGVLKKSEIATAAQERYLSLLGRLPGVDATTFPMLHALATKLEAMPGE